MFPLSFRTKSKSRGATFKFQIIKRPFEKEKNAPLKHFGKLDSWYKFPRVPPTWSPTPVTSLHDSCLSFPQTREANQLYIKKKGKKKTPTPLDFYFLFYRLHVTTLQN